MFKSFKTKLNSVKKDVTAGIKLVTTGIVGKHSASATNVEENEAHTSHHVDSAPVHQSGTEPASISKCNDAAQDLLHRYEVTWEDLYKTTQSNTKKAKVLAKDLHSVENMSSVSGKRFDEFWNEVKELPSMLTKVQEITDQIADLHSHCAIIEDSLVVLENLCEEAELEKAKISEEQKLLGFTVQKNKELTQYSERLAKDHKQKIIAIELRDAELRREKELFYQKAFEEDLKRYKTEQTLRQSKMSLNQITIEPNTEEVQDLENFLNDKNGEQSNVVELPPNQVDSSETNADASQSANSLVTSHEERRGSGESTTRTASSSDALEWDEKYDALEINTSEELETSLEKEINAIIQPQPRQAEQPEPSDNLEQAVAIEANSLHESDKTVLNNSD